MDHPTSPLPLTFRLVALLPDELCLFSFYPFQIFPINSTSILIDPHVSISIDGSPSPSNFILSPSIQTTNAAFPSLLHFYDSSLRKDFLDCLTNIKYKPNTTTIHSLQDKYKHENIHVGTDQSRGCLFHPISVRYKNPFCFLEWWVMDRTEGGRELDRRGRVNRKGGGQRSFRVGMGCVVRMQGESVRCC